MSGYIKEWPCCGDVTETQGWEPDNCPFCESDQLRALNAELVEALEYAANVLGTDGNDPVIDKALGKARGEQ